MYLYRGSRQIFHDYIQGMGGEKVRAYDHDTRSGEHWLEQRASITQTH